MGDRLPVDTTGIKLALLVGGGVLLFIFAGQVLRDTTEPILSPGAQEGVSEGYADVAAGRTMSTEEAREHFGIDQN